MRVAQGRRVAVGRRYDSKPKMTIARCRSFAEKAFQFLSSLSRPQVIYFFPLRKVNKT